MDCSKTENYFKEKARMTKSDSKGYCDITCNRCPLDHSNNGLSVACKGLERNYAKKAIEIVQKWSDEHPQKTILQDFFSKYPKAPLSTDGQTPRLCPDRLGYAESKEWCGKSCEKCWNRPIEEE